MRTRSSWWVAGVVCVASVACAPTDPPTSSPESAELRRGRTITRTYFIAADEVIWDYTPEGFNVITGQPFGDTENVFVQQGPDRIGSRYIKALYREYTDETFTTLKPVEEEWVHLGTMGPLIRAVVGDKIEVHFKNNTTRPVSIHPHGVFYDKDAEGAGYNDGTSGDDVADDAVAPGDTFVYEWDVPERAGPADHDGSTVFWMYHSHTDEVADTYAGLIGPMIITGRGLERSASDPRPIDIDREFVTMFHVFDENQSPYLDANIEAFAGDPSSVDVEDEGFGESNLMHSINGYLYGNLPGLDMKVGESVRWYLMGMGTEVDLHTPHWHGQTATVMGMRTDVVNLLPASMGVGEMQPDNPGTWLYHCHVNDHLTAGMTAVFNVEEAFEDDD